MADKPIKLLKTANGESFYPRVATGNEKGTPFDGEEGAKLIDKVEQLQTSVENLVPYTGATKDIDIGTHVFTVGNETAVHTQITSGSIKITNPQYNSGISPYAFSINGTTIYWPTVSADPNGKYFALKSDIPANIKDGTGNGSLNQIKDGTGTTFSIDDSSGNSKNPNAYALDNTIKGDIVFGGVGDYSTSLCGKSSAQGKRSVAQGTTTIAKGNYSHAEGDNSVALGPDSHAEGYATTTSGDASHSEGDNTVAQGNKSHAEGLSTKAIGEASHSEGKETSAESYASHTEGYKTRTTKEYAHAEGENTLASGQAAHAEGVYTVASGNASMAVGSYTKALGYGSFACGAATQAIGEYSFAQGYQTKASSPRQAVFGTLNSDDENALLIVGNGDGNGRKNVFTVNKDGTTTISKDPVNDFDVATKGYVDRGIGVKQDKITPTNKLPASNVSGLATVATSGSYNDLNNKPTIPAVNNGKLTIQKNGTAVATFTANQSGNATANITVPTKTSELTNDSFVTVETTQNISGNKIFRGDYTYLETDTTRFGKVVYDRRNVGDAPQTLSFIDSARTTSGYYGAVIYAGAGDWLYCAHAKDNFDIRASYGGDGSENDTYDPNLGYTHRWLNNLTDWKYTTGWHVLASKITSATPAIIQIKFTDKLYTNVLRLILTGHTLKDPSGDYSGFLDDYTIEVCTDYENDTWVTVVNRTNANDNIGRGLIYGLQLDTYTKCYGIRLKVTKCHVTGSGYQFINITTMQLRDYRPAFTVSDSVGAVSQLGGDVWGELKVHSNLTTGNILPMSNNGYALGTESLQYYKICAQDFYESGQKLIDKYLGISAQAADSAKLNGQPSSHYLTSIKMNGTTKTSTNSTVDLGTVITSHQSLSGYMKVVSNSNGVMTITY